MPKLIPDSYLAFTGADCQYRVLWDRQPLMLSNHSREPSHPGKDFDVSCIDLETNLKCGRPIG
jgi:hypothetical protein